jgi:hypothetical protein
MSIEHIAKLNYTPPEVDPERGTAGAAS